MASDTDGLKSMVIRLPVELHEALRAAAAEHDISMAQAIRAAIRGWVAAPSLTEVRPASNRGPCTCPTSSDGWDGNPETQPDRVVDPRCPQHALVVG